MLEPSPRLHRVTITDIAKALGITATTVSNAFNRPDQLSATLRARILETAREMGYPGPDAAARSMRHGRIRTIGVLYADRLSNAFVDDAFVLFLQGLSTVAEQDGFCMTLIPGSGGRGSEPEYVGKAVVDGFVVYSMADDDPLVAAAQARGLPLVIVDSPGEVIGPSTGYVGIDDFGAARQAAEHVLALGHRRIAILSAELAFDRRGGMVDAARLASATYGVNRDRLRGYLDTLSGAGLGWPDLVVEEVGETELDQATRQAALRILERVPRPTALLAMSDRMVIVVLDLAKELGIRMPDDLSIVGFDDIPASRRTTPALTTVRQPHVEKGARTGAMLMDLLEGRRTDPYAILETELILRGSTTSPQPGLAGKASQPTTPETGI
jgi:DNA-binding LacI/PurR family transcriptional regulator